MKKPVLWWIWSIAIMALAAPGLRAAMHTVNISGFSFSPSSITINVGDTVVWPNVSGHTVTGSEGAEAFCGSSFPQSCTVTFNAAGMFPYHCIPHRSFGMTGVVNVQGGSPNTPPTVTITSPAAGTSFFAPANVSITAAASDPGGSVTSVAFYTNGVALLTDNAAPYAANPSLGAGVYTLTAIATDNAGLMSTSAPVNITVLAAPFVEIVSPTNDTVLTAPANGEIVASASDPDGTVTNVQFFANGGLLGADDASPFSVQVNALAAGNYALTAIATDDSGLMSTSAPVNIQVVSQPASPIHLDFTGEGSGINSNGQFSFTFNTDAGFEYVVEGSENLTNWTALATNTGSGAPLRYTESATGLSHRFFRVLLRN